ncbi:MULTISPECIES: TnsD family Tn7-like transposition protein [Aliagarivorans]|uniref:TnsD family Tn7-like transposition protein n=1 Tax=Aliagarivorans TaxID=882379 RepID=UPI0004071C95|nr:MULTISPECIES: TnsD family Tn7-like transposition protein [Aliagarivorans]
MLGFPVPYPDELLYSVIARAGSYEGITSPKELIEEVFANRTAIASIDLPSHLIELSTHYPDSLGLDAEKLAYRHTLFPLCGAFVPESRRTRILKHLAGRSQGAAHMLCGVASSKVKAIQKLRYCPLCVAKQFELYGEGYWKRSWQIAGVSACSEHGELIQAKLPVRLEHRHQCYMVTPDTCPLVAQSPANWQSLVVSKHAKDLLNSRTSPSPEFAQWTKHYWQLARDFGATKGKHINHALIRECISEYWSDAWLASVGLSIADGQFEWLKSMFRKHRKAFSYLQHIAVMQALHGNKLQIIPVINGVGRLRVVPKQPLRSTANNQDRALLRFYRRRWLRQVIELGTKVARLQGSGAEYAWLYRNDRSWLKRCNRRFRVRFAQVNNRVQWGVRDKSVVRYLIRLRNEKELQLTAPRWTKNRYLTQTRYPATIEKNMHKLPLTQRFLSMYSETVSEYQIRRIAVAISELIVDSGKVKRWKVLKNSGLSRERITEQASAILDWSIKQYGQGKL